MKNKKLLIAAGVCLLLITLSTIEMIYATILHPYLIRIYIKRICSHASFLCVIGAFAFDGLRKHRSAIACVVFCLVDALIRYFILDYVLLAESMPVVELFKSIAYVIPDVVLMVFVVNKKWSRNTWVVIGIVLTLLTICNDYIYYIPFTMKRGAVVRFLFSIPFGLVYLFGFMDRTPAKNKEQKKTTTSYLEQYKQEHGME